MLISQIVSYVFHKFVLRFFVARTVTFKEMNGLFTSLIRHEYFADVRMLNRVICGCLSAATSANYPLQHPHFTPSQHMLVSALHKLDILPTYLQTQNPRGAELDVQIGPRTKVTKDHSGCTVHNVSDHRIHTFPAIL